MLRESFLLRMFAILMIVLAAVAFAATPGSSLRELLAALFLMGGVVSALAGSGLHILDQRIESIAPSAAPPKTYKRLSGKAQLVYGIGSFGGVILLAWYLLSLSS